MSLSLQAELEKLADWRALPTARKVASRLELLQSPAPRDRAFQLPPERFELIAEPLSEASLTLTLTLTLTSERGIPNPNSNPNLNF